MRDGSLQRRTFEALPEALQHKMMRRGLNIDPAYPEDIEFAVARDPQEIKAACEILYAAYTDAGFMVRDGSGYRFTVYHALPYCYTLIARQRGEIIATVTLIVRSGDPLPIENIFPLDGYLGFGRRIVEVSALTIHPKARGNRGRILFPLFKYLYQVAYHQLGGTDLVLTCNPKHLAFYKAIILFESISDEVRDSYDFVDGAPAVAARLDLTTVPEVYGRTYGGKPANKNLDAYMLETEFPQFGIPDRAETVYEGNRWSPEQLEWMLGTMAKGRSALSEGEMAMLRRAYGADYDALFERFAPPGTGSKGSERIDLNADAHVVSAASRADGRLLALTDDTLLLSLGTDTVTRDHGLQLELGGALDGVTVPIEAHSALGHGEHLFRIAPAERRRLLQACRTGPRGAATVAAE